jgi:hypothetical protein
LNEKQHDHNPADCIGRAEPIPWLFHERYLFGTPLTAM